MTTLETITGIVSLCTNRRKRFCVTTYSVRVLAALASIAALVLAAPVATADQTDLQYLAALRHGGLCCASQPDTPIWYSTPADAIDVGHKLANAMTANPTYAEFQNLRAALGTASSSPGQHRLNGFEEGEIIVVAAHYYASPAVECALMKQMGGAMGEAPYWYGPVTYSGGLAVQPRCVVVLLRRRPTSQSSKLIVRLHKGPDGRPWLAAATPTRSWTPSWSSASLPAHRHRRTLAVGLQRNPG